MQQKLVLKLSLADAANETIIISIIARLATVDVASISGYSIIKKSIDARGKNIYINLTVNAFINEAVKNTLKETFSFKDVTNAAKNVLIIGSGPAGIFAALQLLENGIKPIILERGKDVRARRRDLAKLNKEGIVNPESNYCFGEGGAGTYSDGKLYTRSNKRGDIDRILDLFVYFGAPKNITYDSHPHIGTNKLPQIITAMHAHIKNCGGEVLFEKKVVDFKITDSKIAFVTTQDGETFTADAYILATGHSARDIFTMLHSKDILIEAKPFAMGVRIEHPQNLIDKIQYHCTSERDIHLPAAAYSLVQQVNGKGVFSFCMCPGGIIAPAATHDGELVVNGWSPSKRNNAFANSGIVVQVEKEDALASLNKAGVETDKNDPLIFLKFQKMVEEKAYVEGGGNFKAPAQRMQDFVNRKLSATLPTNSYLPGLTTSKLEKVLPQFIYDALAEAFQHFGKKLKGYYTNEAVIVAVESRTSSPVRIPRNTENLQHPQLINLYPCGEGAGYAGGIVSAAMDGEKVANRIASLNN